MLKAFITHIMDWYQHALDSWGYPLVALMMAAESTIFPLPSELIIPPAAHLAHKSGNLNVIGIIIAGTIGSWVGATIMYWVSRAAGRPLLMRYGSYVFIAPAKIEGAERWSSKFGSMGIFISRLLPVVRHLIGIPAGIVRMDYRLYSLFTILGSAIWCAVLCWLGITMGQDPELMQGKAHRVALWLGGIMLTLGAIYYFFVHRHMKDTRA